MNGKWMKTPGRLKELLRSERAGKILFFVGIAGIALIFLSALFPSGGGKTGSDGAPQEDYAAALEKKLEALVAGITGGEANVVVTLESTSEYIYANETKQNTDTTEDVQSGEKRKVQQKDNTENKYIIMDSSDGGEAALLVTELLPKVKGVVIVIDRADDEAVCERIVKAVTTALDLSARRVCVTGPYRRPAS